MSQVVFNPSKHFFTSPSLVYAAHPAYAREARGTHGAAVQFVLTTRQSPQSYMQQHKPLRERTGFVIHETVGAERDGGRPSPAASPRCGPILPTSSFPSACRSGLARLLVALQIVCRVRSVRGARTVLRIYASAPFLLPQAFVSTRASRTLSWSGPHSTSTRRSCWWGSWCGSWGTSVSTLKVLLFTPLALPRPTKAHTRRV